MANTQQPEARETSFVKAEDIFAKKGKEVVKNGMILILERLKFAKKYDAKIREAICALDEEGELKATQVKELTQAIRRAGVMDTSEVLSLVTEVIGRLGSDGESNNDEHQSEVVVTLDERVEKWAQ